MNFIWGLITGIIVSTVSCLIWLKTRQPRLDSKAPNGINEDEAKKKENFRKIEEFIATKDKFTNDDLQNLLGVSDTTIGRYLDELEGQGKIKQVGKTGHSVYYTK